MPLRRCEMAKTIEVKAWNNGQHHKSGAGYGVKFFAVDRDYLWELFCHT